MGETMKYKVHPATACWPMMDQEEMDGLVADIKANGLINPVTLHGGLLIDGRNRIAACKAAGVEVRSCEYDGDPIAFIVSSNHRRNLTIGQRAAVAAGLATLKDGQRKDRQGAQNCAPTQEEAASTLGVSRRSVQSAAALKADEPELFAEVLGGTVTLSQATASVQRKKRTAKIEAAIEDAVKNDPPTVALDDAVEWLQAQQPASLLLTDPPYMTDVPDIAAFAQSWLPLALSKVKPTGRAFICVGAYPEELAAYFSVAMPKQVLVWTYRNTLGPSPKMGYKQNWQAILYYEMPDAPPIDCPVMVEQFSVQDINAPDGRLGDRYHAWQKPMEIADRFIRHSTNPGDTVLDPFCCTGTFLLAASALGRIGRGCDIDKDALKIAVKRGCVHG